MLTVSGFLEKDNFMEFMSGRMKLTTFLFLSFLTFSCSGNLAQNSSETKNEGQTASGKSEEITEPSNNVAANNSLKNNSNDSLLSENQIGQPKTIRDFFMLLPEKYFLMEGCVREKDKDCKKAKTDYLKTYAEVEDTANGYLKAGCDGAQSCLEMAIFKRPDSSYIVALAVTAEVTEDNYFLDYKNGTWTDISAEIVPDFSKKNQYEIPQNGTTVKVYAKKVIEKGDDYEVTEKGAKLYDLIWKDGKFQRQK